MTDAKTWVEVKCICCGNKRKVYAGEVKPGDMPECEKCWDLMIVTGKAGCGHD